MASENIGFFPWLFLTAPRVPIMGCYDTIKFRCPICQSVQLLQTKYGKCNLATYTLESAPARILGPLENEIHTCTVCESQVRFLVKALATAYVPVVQDEEDEEEA